MKIGKKGWAISGGTLAFGVAGWVAIRLYARQRVLEELEAEGLSQAFAIARRASSVAGSFSLDIDLNLPPPVALAMSMVPIFGINSPYDALDDIALNGRQSKYWPKGYSQPSPLAALGLEDLAFRQLAERT